MNITELKNTVLKLLDSYSSNGAIVSQSDNADYINKVCAYANEAQMELARLGYNRSIYSFTQPKNNAAAAYIRKDLPSDFIKLLDNGVKLNNINFVFYTLNGRDNIVFSNEYDGTFDVYYHKIPAEITSSTSDSTELEVDKDVHSIIPYFVASLIVADENQNIAKELMTVYQNKLGILISSEVNERRAEANEPKANQSQHPAITR